MTSPSAASPTSAGRAGSSRAESGADHAIASATASVPSPHSSPMRGADTGGSTPVTVHTASTIASHKKLE